MVQLTKIYTKGGDGGKTSLGNGSRVAKHDLRVAAYGTVDEANAAIGLARLEADTLADGMLGRIQNDMFDLGADLCRPMPDVGEDDALRIQPSQVQRLENEIDGMNAMLAPLNSFILPGGTPTAAALHVARTVVRRAERLTVQLAAEATISAITIEYLNRLSDHLFVLARYVNDQGKADVLWVPGANR
ncbi:MAG: cob(I)yrinic acid a,c-diamide adenosyltransferase [Geminicoccaceae bacterium]